MFNSQDAQIIIQIRFCSTALMADQDEPLFLFSACKNILSHTIFGFELTHIDLLEKIAPKMDKSNGAELQTPLISNG